MPTMTKKATKAKAQAEILDSLGVVPGWDTVPDLKRFKFDQLMEKRTRLADEIKFRKEQMEPIDEELMAALTVAGMSDTGVMWEDRKVKVTSRSGASKVSAEKLLAKGVAANIIAECTEKGKSSAPYLNVGKPKERE